MEGLGNEYGTTRFDRRTGMYSLFPVYCGEVLIHLESSIALVKLLQALSTLRINKSR